MTKQKKVNVHAHHFSRLTEKEAIVLGSRKYLRLSGDIEGATGQIVTGNKSPLLARKVLSDAQACVAEK